MRTLNIFKNFTRPAHKPHFANAATFDVQFYSETFRNRLFNREKV